jgi:hypothetical protein
MSHGIVGADALRPVQTEAQLREQQDLLARGVDE